MHVTDLYRYLKSKSSVDAFHLATNGSKKLIQQISVINIWYLNIKIQRCNLFCKLIHFKPIVPVRFLTSYILFKCFGYNAECERNVSPSSFDEQLPDLKSHVLSLSTQWMVCYQSAPGGVAGMKCCSCGGLAPEEECWTKISNNSNNNKKKK